MRDDLGETARGTFAPGWPGISPRWTSSAKSGVGTALAASNRVWFTLSHGIVNEVYWPRVDRACTRDLGLIVTDGRAFFSEEKRHTGSVAEPIAPGVPAYRLVNTCVHGRYRVEKEILTDPRRDTLMQVTRFVPLSGRLTDYRVYVLLAPHLGNRGSGNTAWLGNYKGVPMLFATRGGDALALASSVPWVGRSAGFVGSSDGWQDLARHRELTWQYERAENGNVALTAGIDITSGAGEFILVLGFGRTAEEAAHQARGSLLDDYRSIRDTHVKEWSAWQADL